MRAHDGSWFGLAFGLGLALSCTAQPASEDCPVGAKDCACTQGGGCDYDLTCVDGFCKKIDNGGTTSTGGGVGDGGSGAGDGGPSSGGPDGGGDTMALDTSGGVGSGSDDGGIKLDVGSQSDIGSGNCAQGGCTRIDMLFSLDSSLSMMEEIGALSATSAFTQIVDTLSQINCGDIEYRIGLTNDNDGGFIGSGAMGHPWFDSNEMTSDEIATAFNSAANSVLGNGGTALGCEHVLTSATGLLSSDTTGFLRDDALLVLVLVTDVDDYGYFDQMGFGGPCDSLLCTETPSPVMDLQTTLLGLKNDTAEALAAIVVAGDPMEQEGMDLCQQPASCCGTGGLECGQALQAARLYDFAGMQAGSNGVTLDICQGADQLPGLIQDALGSDIDLACQTYQPAG